MKLKQLLALILAAILLLACIPAGHADEVDSPEVVGFEIINEDDLPELIWNEHYSNQGYVQTAVGVWNLDNAVRFRVTFADGSTEEIGFLDTVNGQKVSASYEIGGAGEKNVATYTLAGISTVCDVAVIFSPVDRIEIVSEPDPVVVGEDALGHKLGHEIGIRTKSSWCYEGLSFRVYYKDGTSELLNHEDLTFVSYPEEVSVFYEFPRHNGYSVEVEPYLYEVYNYWSGSIRNEDGIIPMYVHYKGQVARFDLTVLEGPVAKVIQPPFDTTEKEANEVFLCVGITGPDVTYQWQYRVSEDAPWQNVEGATEPELTFNAALEFDGRQYRCVGTDKNGVVVYTEAATLTVLEVDKFEYSATYTYSDLVLGSDGVYRTPKNQIVYIGLKRELSWLGSFATLYDYVNDYEEWFDLTYWDDLVARMDENGDVVLTEETLGYLITLITGNPGWGETEEDAQHYLVYDKKASPVQSGKSGWYKEDGAWYYYLNGEKKTGWLELGSVTYYLKSDGTMATGWQKINGQYYYFNSSGAMQKGWLKLGNNWFYLKPNGAMVTGTYKIDGVYYGFNASGALVSGWQKIDGKWHLFNSNGTAKTGWLQSGGKWYYLAEDGEMAVGMQRIDHCWYGFNENGHMVTGWQKIDGKWHLFNSNGTAKTGWYAEGGKWYYLAEDALMTIGWKAIGGSWYYFNSNGHMTTGWQKVGGNWFYMNGSGVMVTGWLKLGTNWYYFNSSGAMVTGTHTIGGRSYTFNASGVWIA